MQARFYLPWLGRFGSPDPARDQHFELTQSWNIYGYVQNNPTMSIDPTGMIENPATANEAEKKKGFDTDITVDPGNPKSPTNLSKHSAQTETKSEYEFKKQQLMEQGATRINQIAEGYDYSINSFTKALENHVSGEYKKTHPDAFIEGNGFKFGKELVGFSTDIAKALGSKVAGPLGVVKDSMKIIEGLYGTAKLVSDWNNKKLSSDLTALGNQMLKSDPATRLLFGERTRFEVNKIVEINQVKQAYREGLAGLAIQYGF